MFEPMLLYSMKNDTILSFIQLTFSDSCLGVLYTIM